MYVLIDKLRIQKLNYYIAMHRLTVILDAYSSQRLNIHTATFKDYQFEPKTEPVNM